MAELDITFYLAGVIIILVSIYALPIFRAASTRFEFFLERTKGRPVKRITPPCTPVSGDDPSFEVLKEPRFGTEWWSADRVFALERRSLFSTRWLFATHRSRFSKPGDYLTLSVAGFSFFLILGKDDILRGFHNVCRHRAYEVTRKECGSSTVLGCRYHGWSYDTTGKLTKAPEFENVKGFDKSKNSLFEVHTKIDENGLIFVNLDADEVEDTIAARTEKIVVSKIKDVKKVDEWKFEGAFNWKLAAPSQMPSVITSSKRSKMLSSQLYSTIMRFLGSDEPVDIEVSKNTKITWYDAEGLLVTARLLPQSASKTIIAYDVYALPERKEETTKALIKQMKETSLANVQQLEKTQAQLTSGDAVLSDDLSSHQDAIQSILRAHLKLERLCGREIQPAARQSTLSAGGKEDDDCE